MAPESRPPARWSTRSRGPRDCQPVAIGDIGELPIAPKPPRSALRRAIGLVTFSLVLAGIAFGATYIYSDPMLQMQLGIKPLIDSLPWKHEELVADAKQHPLELQQLSIMLSSREGDVASPPKASFTDTEITNQKYLKWQATFKNDLEGLEGRNDSIEARFFDPAGTQLAVSDQSLFVGPSQKTVDFSGVALMPDLTTKPAGAYKVALYLDDKYLAAQQFTVTQDLANKAKAATEGVTPPSAPSAPAEDAAKRAAEEEEKLAKIEQIRRKPLELVHIAFLNSTKTGTPLSGPAESFDVSKVLFVGWEVNFKNRLYKLDSNQYRVDAAYIAPDGRTLGSVNDWKNVGPGDRSVHLQRAGRQFSRRGFFTRDIHSQLLSQWPILRRKALRGDGRYGGRSLWDAAGQQLVLRRFDSAEPGRRFLGSGAERTYYREGQYRRPHRWRFGARIALAPAGEWFPAWRVDHSQERLWGRSDRGLRAG